MDPPVAETSVFVRWPLPGAIPGPSAKHRFHAKTRDQNQSLESVPTEPAGARRHAPPTASVALVLHGPGTFIPWPSTPRAKVSVEGSALGTEGAQFFPKADGNECALEHGMLPWSDSKTSIN